MDVFTSTNNPRPAGRPKGHGISWYLARVGETPLKGHVGKCKKEIVAIKIFEVLLDEKTPLRDFITLVSEVMDRLEGKPVSVNINAEMQENPFDGIDTGKLEALKSKIEKMKQ